MVTVREYAKSVRKMSRTHGVRDSLAVGVVNPLVGIWVERVRGDQLRRDGLRLNVDSDSVSVFTKGAIARGDHERGERELIETHLPGEIDVVELGAGIGYLSTIAAKLTSGTVVAVEANPELVPLLRRNRSLNRVDFDIENAAYAPGRAAVQFPVSDNYKFSSVYSSSGRVATVDGTSLAAIRDAHGIDRCGLLVDVEGCEIELLEEEMDVLRENCDLLIVEFHPEITGREAVSRAKERLRSAGFAAIDRSGDAAVYAKPPR